MIVLLLGSNSGKRRKLLRKARKLIEKKISEIRLKSSVYETEPWGFLSKDLFLNQIICLDTAPEPEALLDQVMQIEKKLGRKRLRMRRKEIKYSDRVIDIDILFYNEQVIDTEVLIVPHPKLHLRRFTLLPLMEILPGLVHPGNGKTVSQLLDECKDELTVTTFK